ncbi:uncharacterized protein KGF55_004901 [Candida pseudojiufengensis]|uniref:uncharacterized protein n=1 Tax=Candida pseudojiufengensis TaxID=497109 RepID=UPI002224EBFF|nr:uncharacterized protein KGF55_004901 [Candida pseudojiufengensis]KAI5960178.1 hypothetical protein KGF55_004901 [Candida pseudojiufengensis]
MLDDLNIEESNSSNFEINEITIDNNKKRKLEKDGDSKSQEQLENPRKLQNINDDGKKISNKPTQQKINELYEQKTQHLKAVLEEQTNCKTVEELKEFQKKVNEQFGKESVKNLKLKKSCSFWQNELQNLEIELNQYDIYLTIGNSDNLMMNIHFEEDPESL